MSLSLPDEAHGASSSAVPSAPTQPSRTDRPGDAARLSYALAASAAAATAVSAQAGVVYSGELNYTVPPATGILLKLDGNSTYDLFLTNYIFGYGVQRPYQGVMLNYAPGRLASFSAGPSNTTYVRALSFSDQINLSTTSASMMGTLAYGSQQPNAQFNTAANKYIGLAFSSGSSLYYGWVRVSINNASRSFVVHDYAYDDTGAGIAAGMVPAPGALGLLAAGAAGVGLLRGRKR